VAACSSAGKKHCAFNKGFGSLGVFFAFVDAADNDSGSGFAFHSWLLFDKFIVFSDFGLSKGHNSQNRKVPILDYST
jgi:hypothetical protein